MKTTIEISDPLLNEAKAVAAREGSTVRALVEEGLRAALAEHRQKAGFSLRDAAFKGRGLQPEAAEGSWERIRELAYEGRGGWIAVDTNVLVYAHRIDSQWHEPAARSVRELADGRAPWAIPWPCIHEFLAITTHRRIFNPPTPMARALDQVAAWLESPSLVLLGESDGYFRELRGAVEKGHVSGPTVHDARIAALCRHHGINELWSADRDFSRFKGLKVRNPLVA